MNEFTGYFGEDMQTFAFPSLELVEELEAKTGKGIGSLFRSFKEETFHMGDLLQIIRLGMIGGGKEPIEADRLVRLYGVVTPHNDVMGLADGIISAMFFGGDDSPNPLAGMAESLAHATAGAPVEGSAFDFSRISELPDSVHENAVQDAARSGDLAAAIQAAYDAKETKEKAQ